MKTQEEIRNLTNFMIYETAEDGGIGMLYRSGKPFASVIWSNGGGWEHVSIAPLKRSYTPNWEDMCKVKDMFFRDDEVAVEYHPAKSDYVNNIANCLHLWRPMDVEMPTPPSIYVGIKGVEIK